jgi:hypothetical protein
VQQKSYLCIPFLGIARPQSQHSCVCERFVYFQDRSTYWLQQNIWDRSWKNINLSQIYECSNRETEHYNSVLEIKRLHSFISGNTEMGTRIYIGFSPALHLNCGSGGCARFCMRSESTGFNKPCRVAPRVRSGDLTGLDPEIIRVDLEV